MVGYRLSSIWLLVAITLLLSTVFVASRRIKNSKRQLYVPKAQCGDHVTRRHSLRRPPHYWPDPRMCESEIRDPNRRDNVRIVGGKQATRERFPFHVSILVMNNDTIEGHDGYYPTRCSGVLIDEDIVLTSAHCLPTGPSDEHPMMRNIVDIYVSPSLVPVWRWPWAMNSGKPPPRLPDHPNPPPPGPYPLVKATRRACKIPSYDGNLKDDYGILWLSDSLRITSRIAPACLSTSGFKFQQQGYLLGQGYTEARTYRLPDGTKKTTGVQPQCVPYLPVTRVDCPAEAGSSVLCTESSDDTHKGGTCLGDDGGPVVIKDPANGDRWAVVGLTSRTEGDCRCGQVTTGFHADLSSRENRDFILREIQDCVTAGTNAVFVEGAVPIDR